MITNISNAYIGDASISRIYQGSELVYENSHPDILCEYLQAGEDSSSAGRADVWFDTGHKASYNVGIEIRWQLPKYNTMADGTNDALLYGTVQRTTAGAPFSGDHYFMSPTSSNSGKFCRWRSLTNVVDTHSINSNAASIWVTCDASVQYVRVSNGLSTNATASSTGNTFTYNSYIFAGNIDGAAGTKALSGTKIYYVKIVGNKNNNLVRFFIPVLHWDGSKYVPCFYDKAQNNYHYNQGTGTVYYKIKNDYLLDYIGTSATAGGTSPSVYFDTGIKIKQYMSISTKFIVGGTGAATECYIVGTRKDGSHKYGIFCPINSNNTVTYCTADGNGSMSALDFQTNKNIPDTEYRVTGSHWNSSNGRALYVNNSSASNSTTAEAASSVYDTSLGIFGINVDDGARVNTRAGTKIKYVCVSQALASPSASYNLIPVLHNGVPAFLDIKANTYVYNKGTDTPYYKFK